MPFDEAYSMRPGEVSLTFIMSCPSRDVEPAMVGYTATNTTITLHRTAGDLSWDEVYTLQVL